MEEQQLIVRCECHSPDHTIFFDYDGEDGDLYLTIHLTTHRGFWKRLWYGMRYAFGYRSRFGEWDEVIIRSRDCPRIRELLQKKEEHSARFAINPKSSSAASEIE